MRKYVAGRRINIAANTYENREVSQFQFSADFIFTFKIKTCQIPAVHLVALIEDRKRAL